MNDNVYLCTNVQVASFFSFLFVFFMVDILTMVAYSHVYVQVVDGSTGKSTYKIKLLEKKNKQKLSNSSEGFTSVVIVFSSFTGIRRFALLSIYCLLALSHSDIASNIPSRSTMYPCTRTPKNAFKYSCLFACCCFFFFHRLILLKLLYVVELRETHWHSASPRLN